MWDPECCFIKFLKYFSENYLNFYIVEYRLRGMCLKDTGGMDWREKK